MEGYNNRTPLVAVVGKTYKNKNGLEYLCIGVSEDGLVQFRRPSDGWTLFARGVNIYEDGCIEWAYSKDGYFAATEYDESCRTKFPELDNYTSSAPYEWDVDRSAMSDAGFEIGTILDDKTLEDVTPALSKYQIVFEVGGERYYFYVNAINMLEALGIFFVLHPHITNNEIIDHTEV